MTKEKGFKKRVRAEAKRTGKSYAATRARLERERANIGGNAEESEARTSESETRTPESLEPLHAAPVAVKGAREEERTTSFAPTLSDLAAAAVAANPGIANPGLFDIILAQATTKVFLAPKLGAATTLERDRKKK